MLKLEANVNGMKKVESQLRFFLNLQRKPRSVKPLVRKLEANGKQIYDHQKKKKKKKKIMQINHS